MNLAPAGARTFRVTIEDPPAAQDTFGGLSGSWTVVDTVSASFKALRGTEQEIARKLYPKATCIIGMRFNSNFTLTTDMRLIFRTRTLAIGYIDNVDELDIDLMILCSEER